MTILFFFPPVLRHLDRSPELVEGRSGEIPVLAGLRKVNPRPGTPSPSTACTLRSLMALPKSSSALSNDWESAVRRSRCR